MPRVTPLDIEENSFFRILGYLPNVAAGWQALDKQIRFGGTLDPELKEQVRRSMAPGVGCEFCATLGGPPADEVDQKVAVAVAYAQALIADHRELDDSMFDVLREEFTEAEIVELTVWICFMTAGQMFGSIMDVGPATDSDVEAFHTGIAASTRERAATAAR
jgi:alkylhydroperoxidase family enzyme